MNFKKTWKRANDGFTLVELIVVIAILAILAGIAVPAYSGYIKKANQAADYQVLAAVNTAFAAAALENGDDLNTISDATLAGSETTITGVASVKATGADTAKYDEAFKRYLGGDATMKVLNVKSLDFVPGVGFVDPANSSAHTSVSFKGNNFYVSNQAVTSLQNSTFGQLGGESLMKEVSNLTNMVGAGDIDLTSMLADDTYMRSLASYMGIENAATMDRTDLDKAIDAKTSELGEEGTANVMVNGLVYYAAERTTQMDAADVTSFLTSGNVAGNLGDDQATKLANASMAFGMYTAFVNSDQYTGAAGSAISDPMTALKTISGTGEHSDAFKKYMESTEGQADLTAYMSAMNIINDSAGNDGTLDVLAGGFDDPELVALMQQVIGK